MLELLILKCFGTGPNLEKTFGQVWLGPLVDSENGIVQTYCGYYRVDNSTLAYMARLIEAFQQ